MVKYLSFHNSSFALWYFKCKWQGLQCDTPLFCFVMSCWDLPNQDASCHHTSWYLWKALIEYRCTDLRLFGATRWKKLSIIEPFCQQKLNKIKTENCIGIWGHSWCCWKALGKSDLIDFISQFSELRCERYIYFWSGFCCWKFKQIAKIGFGRKNELSPQCVHTWFNGTGYTSTSWN